MDRKSLVFALMTLRPGAEWNLRADTIDGIEWLDKNQMVPTNEEIETAAMSYVPPPSLQDQLEVLQAQVAALLAAQGK